MFIYVCFFKLIQLCKISPNLRSMRLSRVSIAHNLNCVMQFHNIICKGYVNMCEQ